MKTFFLSVMAATAVVLATSQAEPPAPEEAVSAGGEAKPAGVMPAGPLFGPLGPEEIPHHAVAVPEPVWASVLAACAVTLLRRGRSY